MPDSERRAASPAAAPAGKRVRRHRRRPLLVRYGPLLTLVLLLWIVPAVWNWMFNSQAVHAPLAGYITDTSTVEQEYLTFLGSRRIPRRRRSSTGPAS
jgi:hypothetical protein